MTDNGWGFGDLRALFINCTLKRSPEVSNTQGLIDTQLRDHASATASTVDVIRAIDHDIATGVWPDMTEHGWATRRVAGRSTSRSSRPTSSCSPGRSGSATTVSVMQAGHRAAVRATRRLLNDAGQYAYYGRVGGCLITGNEDGIKHCAMNVLYSLQHLGYTIPPQADAGWIGEAGPGPVVPRPGLGRPGERLHQPQHDVHDLEPHAPRAHAEGRPAAFPRTATSARRGTPAPLRLREPRVPLLTRERMSLSGRSARPRP